MEKLQNLQVSCQELSRLATPFLPSHRPNLPGFTDSPEGVANLLLGVANLVVSTVYSAIGLKFYVDKALKLELSITVTFLYSAKSLKFYVD